MGSRRFNKKHKTNKTKQRRSWIKKQHKNKTKANEMKELKKCIRNFSKSEFNIHELRVMAKGIKFIPHQDHGNIRKQIIRDFRELGRKMRCKFHYGSNEDKDVHPFYTKNNFTPPPGNKALENYLFATEIELEKMQLNRQIYNLTPQEKLAIHTIREKENIIVKKSDKTSSLTIMEKENYINEAERQLFDGIHYEQIPEPNCSNTAKEITKIVENMKARSVIDDNTYKFLKYTENDPKPGRLYLLPKVHKIPLEVIEEHSENPESRSEIQIPGRPIISQSGAATERIAEYVDYFLLPVVQRQQLYVKDTKHFIKKIEERQIPQNAILVSYDVSSMYTNMYLNELKEAVNKAYKQMRQEDYEIEIPPKNDLLALLDIILNNNEFEFNGKYFVQKTGVPMGCKSSPEICDIRISEILSNIFAQFHGYRNILLNCKYRDDGAILYNGPEEDIHELFHIANNAHELIKFTYEISDQSINFLDTTVFKGPRFNSEGILDIKTYIKPTENYQFLSRNSAHPQSVFKGFLMGECTRHIRNTNNPEDQERIINNFKVNLMKRGYNEKEIDESFSIAKEQDRAVLLRDKVKHKRRVPLVFVTKYSPRLRKLGTILRKHWHIIEENEMCKEKFAKPPIIAYKRNKNLKEFLTSSTMKN